MIRSWQMIDDETACVRLDAAARERLAQQIKQRGETQLLPLVEMLARGAALTTVGPGTQFPSWRKLGRRGAVVIVTDDTQLVPEGPEAFHLKSLRKLVTRAAAWAVLAGKPPADLYRAAATMATSGRLVILVDTQPDMEQLWTDWLKEHARRTASKLLVTPNAKAYEAMREGAGATRH
jgi:hypothetical protein